MPSLRNSNCTRRKAKDEEANNEAGILGPGGRRGRFCVVLLCGMRHRHMPDQFKPLHQHCLWCICRGTRIGQFLTKGEEGRGLRKSHYRSFLISSSNTALGLNPSNLFAILPLLSMIKVVGIPSIPPYLIDTSSDPSSTG